MSLTNISTDSVMLSLINPETQKFFENNGIAYSIKVEDPEVLTAVAQDKGALMTEGLSTQVVEKLFEDFPEEESAQRSAMVQALMEENYVIYQGSRILKEPPRELVPEPTPFVAEDPDETFNETEDLLPEDIDLFSPSLYNPETSEPTTSVIPAPTVSTPEAPQEGKKERAKKTSTKPAEETAQPKGALDALPALLSALSLDQNKGELEKYVAAQQELKEKARQVHALTLEIERLEEYLGSFPEVHKIAECLQDPTVKAFIETLIRP